MNARNLYKEVCKRLRRESKVGAVVPDTPAVALSSFRERGGYFKASPLPPAPCWLLTAGRLDACGLSLRVCPFWGFGNNFGKGLEGDLGNHLFSNMDAILRFQGAGWSLWEPPG